MQTGVIRVQADWDEEAGVWVASSNDICGLSIEASTMEALRERVIGALDDLLELNGIEAGPDTPIRLVSEQMLHLVHAA